MHEDYRRWTGQDRQAAVDLNSASRRELERLPGITDDDADRIVANRPYPTKEALVNRGILGPRKYDKIEDYVYVSGTGNDRYRNRDADRYDYER
jgi:DNA uptake protein ComE-like DNA-binding protein